LSRFLSLASFFSTSLICLIWEHTGNNRQAFSQSVTPSDHACLSPTYRVQRQVWEFDKNLLQQDALPPVGQYKYEVATIMRAMAMDEFLPAVIAAADDGPDEEADTV